LQFVADGHHIKVRLFDGNNLIMYDLRNDDLNTTADSRHLARVINDNFTSLGLKIDDYLPDYEAGHPTAVCIGAFYDDLKNNTSVKHLCFWPID
jgi:hypothetical protein